MNQELFKAYQRELAKHRENFLKENQKLSPNILLGDNDFDASIENIPLAISLPPQEMPKEQIHKSTKSNSKPLF
jgi:hypothetical protein